MDIDKQNNINIAKENQRVANIRAIQDYGLYVSGFLLNCYYASSLLLLLILLWIGIIGCITNGNYSTIITLFSKIIELLNGMNIFSAIIIALIISPLTIIKVAEILKK